MKILVAKDKFGALRAADPMSEAAIREWGLGEVFEIEFRQPRNLERLRLYWVIVGKAAENLDYRPEVLSDLLKVSCGYADPIQTPKPGVIWWRPKSIAFSSMSEPEFRAYLDLAILKLCEWLQCEPDQLLEAAQSNA